MLSLRRDPHLRIVVLGIKAMDCGQKNSKDGRVTVIPSAQKPRDIQAVTPNGRAIPKADLTGFQIQIRVRAEVRTGGRIRKEMSGVQLVRARDGRTDKNHGPIGTFKHPAEGTETYIRLSRFSQRLPRCRSPSLNPFRSPSLNRYLSFRSSCSRNLVALTSRLHGR